MKSLENYDTFMISFLPTRILAVDGMPIGLLKVIGFQMRGDMSFLEVQVEGQDFQGREVEFTDVTTDGDGRIWLHGEFL